MYGKEAGSEKTGKSIFVDNWTPIDFSLVGDALCNQSQNDDCLDTVEFFKEYIRRTCTTQTDPYWKDVSQIHNCKQIKKANLVIEGVDKNVELSFDEKWEIIRNKIVGVNSAPYFLDGASYLVDDVGVLFLIGIIDTMIRNVYQHSKCSEFSISLESNDNDNNKYAFSIKNDISQDRDSMGAGLTKQFFENVYVDSVDDQRHFMVEMDPDSDKKIYKSVITVYGGKKDEKS